MFSRSAKVFAIVALMAIASAAAVSAAATDKVLLSEVKALTLHANQQTNARRGYPIPQVRKNPICSKLTQPREFEAKNNGN